MILAVPNGPSVQFLTGTAAAILSLHTEQGDGAVGMVSWSEAVVIVVVTGILAALLLGISRRGRT